MTPAIDAAHVEDLIARRIAAREARDYALSDRLRAEIDALGVILMDAKDPVTGALSSTWRPRPPEAPQEGTP